MLLSFYGMVAWLLVALGVLLLAPVTAKARALVEQWEKERAARAQAEPAPERPAKLPEAATAPKRPARGAPRARAHLLGLGVLAALLLFLWPVVILLNSYLIALALSTIMPSGAPIFTLGLGPWNRDIYVNDLIAVVVCLFEAIGGAVWLRATMTLHSPLDAGHRMVVRSVGRIALALTIMSICFEFFAGAYYGLSRRDYAQALSTGLSAGVAGLGEVVVGALVIDFLFIPLVTGFLGLVLPAREPRPGLVTGHGSPPLPWVVRFLAYLDATLMEWLRVVDRQVAGWLKRRRPAPVAPAPEVETPEFESLEMPAPGRPAPVESGG